MANHSRRHTLSDLDLTALLAVCLICGPVRVRVRRREGRRVAYTCRTGEYGDTTSPRARASQRRRQIRHRYGLTDAEYSRLMDAQAGLCWICGAAGVLVVDHDHVANQVRGLLCGKCNVGLGHFGDNPHMLRRAALYIERQGNGG